MKGNNMLRVVDTLATGIGYVVLGLLAVCVVALVIGTVIETLSEDAR